MEIFNMNLWQFFKHKHSISMHNRFAMFEKIWNGLNHLQQNKFAHLDLKLSNILIKTNSLDKWDGENLVITDFGIGGKDLAVLGKRGTPGFASPEQLVGKPHIKSDNYALGRVMVYLFSEWESAWNMLFQPITDNEIKAFNPKKAEQLFTIFSELTKVRTILYSTHVLMDTCFCFFSNFRKNKAKKLLQPQMFAAWFSINRIN